MTVIAGSVAVWSAGAVVWACVAPAAVSAAARAASRKREGVREGKAKDMARGIGRAVSRNGRPRRRRCAPAPRRVQLRQGTVPGPRGATRGRARREAGRDAAVWRREMPME